VKATKSPVIVNNKKTTITTNPILNRTAQVIMYVFLSIVAVFQIFPIVWLFLFSLKNNQEVFNMSPFALPENPKWENYAKVWVEGNISQYFFKTLTYTVAQVDLTVLLASMVTLPITRMNSKASK
jgi:raffinose/stachyose/melibiose transport system permease protein